MKLIKKVCQVCGKIEYKGIDCKRSRFCSRVCWLKYQGNTYKEVECKWCGKTFKRNLLTRSVYCSKKCKREAVKKQQRENKRKHFKPSGHKRRCDICGKSFITDLYKRKYCSKKCASKGRKMKQLERRPRNNEASKKYYYKDLETSRRRNARQYQKHRQQRLEYAKQYRSRIKNLIGNQIDNYYLYELKRGTNNE